MISLMPAVPGLLCLFSVFPTRLYSFVTFIDLRKETTFGFVGFLDFFALFSVSLVLL